MGGYLSRHTSILYKRSFVSCSTESNREKNCFRSATPTLLCSLSDSCDPCSSSSRRLSASAALRLSRYASYASCSACDAIQSIFRRPQPVEHTVPAQPRPEAPTCLLARFHRTVAVDLLQRQLHPVLGPVQQCSPPLLLPLPLPRSDAAVLPASVSVASPTPASPTRDCMHICVCVHVYVCVRVCVSVCV